MTASPADHPETMTRVRLAEEISRSANMTRREAGLVVDAVFEAIAEALRSGEKVELRGFGSFRLRQRGARRVRNPKTGETIEVAPKRVPFFAPGKDLRESLNRSD